MPGWAGPGTHCGQDDDADGWPDLGLDCDTETCAQDNCVDKPNSGQEDSDGDGKGDDCDEDADGDGILNTEDNCPLHENIEQATSDYVAQHFTQEWTFLYQKTALKGKSLQSN